jgi:hypothetical protein
MTYHDYQYYMSKRQRAIELKCKGKLVDIPSKIKPVKPINNWELVGVC